MRIPLSKIVCIELERTKTRRGQKAVYLCDAAPELLEALKQLHDHIAEYARINNLGGFDNHCMRQARAAIAHATGKVPGGEQ